MVSRARRLHRCRLAREAGSWTWKTERFGSQPSLRTASPPLCSASYSGKALASLPGPSYYARYNPMRFAPLLLTTLLLAGCSAGPNVANAPNEGRVAPQAEAFKEADAVVVQTTLPEAEAYRALGMVLAGRGYAIAQSDPALGLITTEEQQVGTRVRIRGAVQPTDAGSDITLRGGLLLNINVGKSLFGSAAREDPYTPISYIGMGGSPARKAWDELVATAQDLAAATEGAVLYARDR